MYTECEEHANRQSIIRKPMTLAGVMDLESSLYHQHTGLGKYAWITDAKVILQERVMKDIKNAGIISGSK